MTRINTHVVVVVVVVVWGGANKEERKRERIGLKSNSNSISNLFSENKNARAHTTCVWIHCSKKHDSRHCHCWRRIAQCERERE